MFLGVVCHHISDLCSPVHVGHKLNVKSLGYPTLSKFHNKVERDILRFQTRSTIDISKPKVIKISDKYFWKIAKETYFDSFLKLHENYSKKDKMLLIDMTSKALSNAVKHTVNVWHTILHKTKMVERKWSMQPLI
jgi:hypothetical protein